MTRFLLLICIFFAIHAKADEKNGSPIDYGAAAVYEPVEIYGFELEYRLAEKGTSQYNLLFERLSDKGLQFKLKVMPTPRANRLFSSNTNACVFPSNAKILKLQIPALSDAELLASTPVDMIHLRVFSSENSPIFSSLEQLNGVRLAHTIGLNVDNFLPGVKPIYESTANEGVRIKMLDAGRIDAILGFTPDVLLAAEALDLPLPKYNNNFAIISEFAEMTCRSGDNNTKFIEHFNKLLHEMMTSGELREIFGPHVDLSNDS